MSSRATERTPFVGPAGGVLDRALAAAEIDRARVYVTNAVKHFKWTPDPQGKRRLHQKPNVREVRACRPWVEQELRLVKPSLIVCLGATAAQSFLGAAFRVTRDRGRIINSPDWPRPLLATIHPSVVLRMPDEEARRKAFEGLVADLRVAAAAVADGIQRDQAG